ncbi:hypothetical protein ACFYXH_42320, partial [Streptomyces sp. NPDC002730]|uniref:hypothetical protein n=1 Tax=Streptomyces sp. NPDC002730 TaxID=3364662 RepID=UPI0036C092FD
PAPPSASATPPANAYTHAASPPAEPADTSAPLNFEGGPLFAVDELVLLVHRYSWAKKAAAFPRNFVTGTFPTL